MSTVEDFITSADLAEYLGLTERSMNSQRGIPRTRIGKVYVYRKSDVAAWLDRRILNGPTPNRKRAQATTAKDDA